MSSKPAELAAQLVFPGFKLGLDDPEAAAHLAAMGVGGFCLYGGDAGAVAALTASLQSRVGTPLLFCADYEDGVASQSAGGTRFPSNMGLAASGDPELAHEKARLTAIEARALGVSWVLAPVADLVTRSENPIINIRSFGSEPAEVSRFVRAAVRGIKAGGALSCLKHFPGHGDVSGDSHLELPTLAAPRAVLDRRELVPFRAGASSADSVMMAHLEVTALDPQNPATLSRAAVAGLLRRRLGFRRLVATDALDMRAIAERIGEAEAAERALLAGCDVLLVPRDPRGLVDQLAARAADSVPLGRAVAAAAARLRAAKRAAASPQGAAALEAVGCAEHARAAERMAQACLAWAKSPAVPLARRIVYLELEADSEADMRGKPFLSRLRNEGIEVQIGVSPGPDDTLVISSFMSPRAYSGRIRHDAKSLESAAGLAARAGRSAAVSFGSPFAFRGVPGLQSILCAFSGADASQEAAAGALTGGLEVKGRMPVEVKYG